MRSDPGPLNSPKQNHSAHRTSNPIVPQNITNVPAPIAQQQGIQYVLPQAQTTQPYVPPQAQTTQPFVMPQMQTVMQQPPTTQSVGPPPELYAPKPSPTQSVGSSSTVASAGSSAAKKPAVNNFSLPRFSFTSPPAKRARTTE